MEYLNVILCIIYLLLAIFNIVGLVDINTSTVFGMTVGTLFIGIGSLFKSKVLKVSFYFISAFFIIAFPLLKHSIESISVMDGNTWMLLALSVTFLTSYLNKTESAKQKIKDKNEDLKNMKELVSTLKKQVEELKNNRGH